MKILLSGKAIPSSDYPLPARCPINSRLSNTRLEAVFALRLPDWQTGWRICLEDAAQSDPLLAIPT